MCTKYVIIFIYILTSFVFGDVGVKRNHGKPKFLTFENTDSEFSVNLEFTVPFLKIRTKNVLDSALGIFSNGFPTLNIDPAAIALSGAVLIGTTILLPLLVKKHVFRHPDHRISRLLDDAEFGSIPVLDTIGEVLDSKTVSGCALRIACITGQQSTYTSDFDPLQAWNNIMRNSIVTSLFNSSTVEDAMLSGRNGRDCRTYTPCPLREDYVPILLNKFLALTSSVA